MSADYTDDRERLNELMADHDEFFSRFGALDESVYADGAIPKLYKELTSLSISVVTRDMLVVVRQALGRTADEDRWIRSSVPSS